MCVDWQFSGWIRSYESFSVHGLLEKQSDLNKITQISLYPAGGYWGKRGVYKKDAIGEKWLGIRKTISKKIE